jgi:hypothetical protein
MWQDQEGRYATANAAATTMLLEAQRLVYASLPIQRRAPAIL